MKNHQLILLIYLIILFFFSLWMNDAINVVKEANAFVLSTVSTIIFYQSCVAQTL